jgi:protein TonB
VVEEDTQIYNTAGIQVQPEFPGGMEKFYKFVEKFQVPEEEGLKGKVFVTFVVEKDGSLTDIKVIRDIGYGTGKEAIRVLKSCPKWNAGEQNGKKVRVQYSLPITIQSAE